MTFSDYFLGVCGSQQLLQLSLRTLPRGVYTYIYILYATVYTKPSAGYILYTSIQQGQGQLKRDREYRSVVPKHSVAIKKTLLKNQLKEQCNKIFNPFLFAHKIQPGPHMNRPKGLTKFLVFARIFAKIVFQYIGVEYADTVSAQSLTMLTPDKLFYY